MYICFILHLHLISVTLIQSDQNGEQIQKSQTYFFCFIECKYAAYLLNQHKQVANGRNFSGAIFAKVSSIKYLHWNKLNFWYRVSHVYTLRKKWRH